MRTRTTSSASPANLTHYREQHAGSCTTPDYIQGTYPTTLSYVPLSVSKVMHDEEVPHYNRQSKRGMIFNNPMDQTITTTTEIPAVMSGAQGSRAWTNCSGVYKWLYTYNRWYGAVPANNYTGTTWLAAPALDVARVMDLATTGAWAKADASEIAGLVTIAEGRKTVNSCVAIFKRLLKIGLMLKKLDVRGLWRQLSPKELSDRYMEARYAIRPIMCDIDNTMQAFLRKVRPLRQTFRSTSSDSGLVSQTNVQTWYVSGFGSVSCNKVTARSITARSGVLASIDSISDISIWGLDKPLDALWELVPFSFVVDWFCNASKVIASWSPSPGISPLASWCVVDDTTVSTIAMASSASLFVNANTAYNDWQVSGGSLTRTYKLRYRVVNPNRAIIPSMKIRLDGFKLLDLAVMTKKLWRLG